MAKKLRRGLLEKGVLEGAIGGEPGAPCSSDKCLVVFFYLNSDLITNNL